MNRHLKSLLSVLTFGLSGIFDEDMKNSFREYKNSGELSNVLSSLQGRYTGSNLTGAEIAANEFNASEAEKARQFSSEEAEKARNFEMEMSNTAKQRQVQDYVSAGINPMFAAGQSVSLPSASNAATLQAASVSPSSAAFNIPGLISSLSQLGVNRAQAKDLNASANLKEVQAEETKTKIDHLIASIEGVNLDNEAKQIANSYLGRMKSAELRVTENEADYYSATVNQINKSIEKMDYEELETFMRACDHAEHIQYLMKQETLTDEQVKELNATVKKLNAETRLINLNIDNFDEMTVVGTESSNFKVGPAGAGESRPVTLKDLKERAKNRLENRKKKPNVGRNSINGSEYWD